MILGKDESQWDQARGRFGVYFESGADKIWFYVKCEKKEAKDDPKVLIQAIKKMELPVTELGKTTGGAAVWRSDC